MTLEATARKDLGDLHKLLLRACPTVSQTQPGSIKSSLAPALGVTHQFIYDWIKENRIPPKYVTAIVTASGGKVTLAEIIPFVIS